MSTPVGYRFHPTEEEIITYYLKLKLNGQDELVDDVIGEIDVYRRDPWDLPDFARRTSDDRVWYFFCRLELLYGNTARANRKTNKGFWKVTGKPRNIKAKKTGRVIGTKKTVVFYFNVYDSKPLRTDWVIHEYQPETHTNPQKPLVLCKLKNKSDEVAGNDEGEASIQVASDGENHATFVVGTEGLQSINLGDSFEFDDEDANLLEFADSFLVADPDVDNSFIPALWSSNMHSGETSANHHRQVQSTQHDDILLMRASSEDSDAPRHYRIAHLSPTSEEHSKTTHIHQGKSKSINLTSQVSPTVVQPEHFELQAEFSSTVSSNRVSTTTNKEVIHSQAESRDICFGFIRMETILPCKSPTPTSVQLCNAIVGVYFLFFIIWWWYTELC